MRAAYPYVVDLALTLVTEINRKSRGSWFSDHALDRLSKWWVERVNVDHPAYWGLQPGSDRNAIGAALRLALTTRFDQLPSELQALLNELGRRPRAGTLPTL